ncbi:hypothetical protein [Edaphobacter aggregans]|uniref:hypothetical protein n=1 Tax=Edaphobacter aggregans TaxID=570835 RepID=UPI000559607E|nr:hypothetical protein [Edaphobacter aggregans]
MKAPFALALIAAVMLASALAHAQAKRPVYVECGAKDEVGKGLCSSLRDAVAKSPRYGLLTNHGKEVHNIISVSSIPILTGGTAASSVVFGYAVGAGPMIFLGHEVITTGLPKIEELAASLLVDLDTLIDAELQRPSGSGAPALR